MFPPPTPASGGQPLAESLFAAHVPRWRGLGVEKTSKYQFALLPIVHFFDS